MNTMRTRITRLTAVSAVVLGQGALGAGPASARYQSWAGSVPIDSVTFVADDASPDGIGKPSSIQLR